MVHAASEDFSTAEPDAGAQALEYVALYAVRTVRFCFDKLTGYNYDKMTEKQWLRRILFLEAIAGTH